jgi:hypothetical protein
VTKNATSIALSCPQKRTARRVASNARLLLGKLSAIVVLSKLSMSVLDRATEHEDAPSAARAAHPLERARRPRYVLYARAMAAAPKQTAAANVKLNRIVHMSRSSGHRRERDRSL